MSTSIKNIVVAVTGGLVILAILGLFLEVRKAPAQPSALKVDEAAKKARTTRTAPNPMTVPDDPWARSSVEATARDTKRATSPDPQPQPQPEDEPRPAARPMLVGDGPVPDVDSDPKLETSTLKEETIRDFDKRNWEAAIDGAVKALAKEPGDIRMMRVLVSSYCAMGEVEKGQAVWNELPEHDQTAMNRRCAKYGVQYKN